MEEKCQTKWPFPIDHWDLLIILAVCVVLCVVLCVVCCACVCDPSTSPPKDDTPPCGRSVHSETAWKPHLKDLPPQYTGTLRPRDLILHRVLSKTYLWSILFNLLNLLIFNLLSSKGIKGAQLCSQVENNISLMSQMHSHHYLCDLHGVNVSHPLFQR